MSRRMITTLALTLAVGSIALWSCADDPPAGPGRAPRATEGDAGAALFEWALGPIDGITSVWHPVPAEFAVPVGTTIRLKCGGAGLSDVHWTSAREVERGRLGSIAEFRVTSNERVVIEAEAERPAGDGGGKDIRLPRSSTVRHACVVRGIDVPPAAIGLRALSVTTAPLSIDASSSSFEIMKAFFAGSAATFRSVEPGRYRTSVGKNVAFFGEPLDPRLAPLVEIRVTGERPRLASSFERAFVRPGVHTVSVGPTRDARTVVIETYRVDIVSHRRFDDIVATGAPVTFEARTSPPGHEREIRWLASTRFGTATPVVGHGPTFTVTFDDAWGRDASSDQLIQWLGVRADNAVFTQDPACPQSVPYDGNDHVVHTFASPDSSVTVVSGIGNPAPVDLVLKDAGGSDLAVFALAPGDGITVTNGSAATASLRMPFLAGQDACLAVDPPTWTVKAPKSATVDGKKNFCETAGKGQWTYHVKNTGTCTLRVRHHIDFLIQNPAKESDPLATNDEIDFTANQTLNGDTGNIHIFCEKHATNTCSAEVTRVSVP